jgi:hypothetical protein
MDLLSQIGILPTLVALLYGLAAVIWGIERLVRVLLNDRLARRLLEILKNEPTNKRTKAFRDLARFVEAQQGKPHWPKLPRAPSTPP